MTWSVSAQDDQEVARCEWISQDGKRSERMESHSRFHRARTSPPSGNGECRLRRRLRSIYLQDSAVDLAHFYRGDAAWMGLFGLHGEYFKTAYTFRATGTMLKTPERLTSHRSRYLRIRRDRRALARWQNRASADQQLRDSRPTTSRRRWCLPASSAPKNIPMPDFSKMKFLTSKKSISSTGTISGYSTHDHQSSLGKRCVVHRQDDIASRKDHNLDVVEEKQATGNPDQDLKSVGASWTRTCRTASSLRALRLIEA